MLIQAILPFNTLVIGFALPIAMKFYDSSYTMETRRTRAPTMQGYKNVQQGVDYVIHFKYSAVLNVVYVTCMYGIGMPVLFPIAAINFFN